MKLNTIIILCLLLLAECSIKMRNPPNNESLINTERFLTKKEISEFVEIISQKSVSREVKDSLTTLIFDRTHEPPDHDYFKQIYNQETL